MTAHIIQMTIEEAWYNFGCAIINDCCQEWLHHAEVIEALERRLEYWAKEYEKAEGRERRQYSYGKVYRTKNKIDTETALLKLNEKWLESDICFSICGLTGAQIITKLNERHYENVRTGIL